MNNWINAHKRKMLDVSAPEGNRLKVEVIPVSDLEELFSKDGEQLAREMADQKYSTVYLYNDPHSTSLDRMVAGCKNIGYKEGFLEAYNLQEVRMEEVKNSAIFWSQSCELLKRENEALKKEVEELRAFKELVTKMNTSSYMQGINEMLKDEKPQP